MLFDVNTGTEEDLLATVVQKASSINGIRALNDEFKTARRKTLDQTGADLKTLDKSIISKEFIDVCLKYIPQIKALQDKNMKEIASKYGIQNTTELTMLIQQQVDMSVNQTLGLGKHYELPSELTYEKA